MANYQKYKSQGFEIYAISLDKKKEAWLKGIADDHLTWQHVSELKYWNSEIATTYAVRAIPANFLWMIRDNHCQECPWRRTGKGFGQFV
ncbi:thioredoxin family protein [Sphingobacterium sp. E70]|nr:thioredoxin family protein [Sphingobacterium sp. E70]ULT25690.1 thioredoxin family protein [Sphingobacterium sp. E70]